MTTTEITEEAVVQDLIQRALREDIGTGDASSLAVIEAGDRCRAELVARQDVVLAGVTVAEAVFLAVDPATQADRRAEDGTSLLAGDVILAIEGSVRSILTAERTALNFLQRLSGVATLTRRFVDRVTAHRAAILDTRKTTPTFRVLEKYAVRCGGGENHRMGLYDRIMLKDNHLFHWRRHHEGGLADMVQGARHAFPDLAIEVEVETVNECCAVLEAAPDWILLDNMGLDAMRACVVLARGRSKLEASGGITLETVAEVAATGIDAISVGALTHSSVWADCALDLLDG